MFALQSFLCNGCFTVFALDCFLYTFCFTKFLFYTLCFTMFSLHCLFYTVRLPLQARLQQLLLAHLIRRASSVKQRVLAHQQPLFAHLTSPRVPSILHCLRYTVCRTMFVLHCPPYTIFFPPFALHCLLCTVCFTLVSHCTLAFSSCSCSHPDEYLARSHKER